MANDDRRQNTGELVADPHERDALGRTVDGTENRDVGIGCRLQDGQPGANDEKRH